MLVLLLDDVGGGVGGGVAAASSERRSSRAPFPVGGWFVGWLTPGVGSLARFFSDFCFLVLIMFVSSFGGWVGGGAVRPLCWK